VARPKLRTDDGELSAGKDRFASPGGYSPFGPQFGGSGSPSGWSGVDEMRTGKTWSTPPPSSLQDWAAVSSSRRRVGPTTTTPELNQMFSDLSVERNWSSPPDHWRQSPDGRPPNSSAWRPVHADVPQSRMKPSPVATDSGYHESPPARHVIGQNRGNTGMPPVGTPPKSSSKESPKEAYERLTAEQARQQYLSRILAMQLGGGGHTSPGSAAPRLPGPFWPSQHPAAVFACEPALGNPAFVAAGKVPVLIGPTGPVAYDLSTMSAFGVPQLVPTFRAFR